MAKKQSTEDLIAGLRRNRGRLPTKGSEALRRKEEDEERKKFLKSAKFE